MKIFFYALREFDELAYCVECKEKTGMDFGYSTEYPTWDNAVLAEGCEAVSCTPCDMGERMLERFHSLGVKYIICRSIGYDHVDRAAAKRLGLKVSNVTYPPDGVANDAVMLMLMCLRKAKQVMLRAESQDYTLNGKIGRDMAGCTVGVIGTGRIGRTVLKNLSGFGCKCLAFDLYRSPEVESLAEYVPFEELLARSDIITLHTNATEENYHLICDETIEKMKPGVILINTARGKLIDSAALIRGIESGKVGAAGLDVLEDENCLYYYNLSGKIIANRDMAVLRSFPNVILMPHTAFYTETNVRHMIEGCFEGCACFGAGKKTPLDVSL